MKKILTLCSICFGLTVFSQDMAKALQANKWNPARDSKTNLLVYYKKPVLKRQEETIQFKTDGKIIRCGIYTESSLDATGKEIMTTSFACDSIEIYEVKKDMLKTQLLKQTPHYYKLTLKGENIEFTAIKEEDYNKQ